MARVLSRANVRAASPSQSLVAQRQPLSCAAKNALSARARGAHNLRRMGRCNGYRGAVRASAIPDPLEEAKAAAMAANALPEGVTSEDLRRFYEIVDSQSWDEVQGKVMTMVQQNELNEGIVLAGQKVLEEANNRNEDPRIISSLQDAVGLLASALQMLSAPPSLRIADECANIMIQAGNPQAAEDEIRKMLSGIFADPEVDVTQMGFLEDVQGFIVNMEKQEEEFQEMVDRVGQGAPEEDVATLIEYKAAREQAFKNLSALLKIVESMG